MKKVTFWCDHCSGAIRDMHLGLHIEPVPGATDIGDWRSEGHDFCSVSCAQDYMMDHWPRKELVAYRTGKLGAGVFLNGIKQGIFTKQEGLKVIADLARELNCHGVLREVALKEEAWS